MDDFERALQIFNLLDVVEGGADAPVKTDDLIRDHGPKWEPIKQLVYFIEDGVLLVWVLTESVHTFLREAKPIINPPILMVPANQMNSLGVLQFQCHQQADCLQGVVAAVHKIPEEQVVKTVDVTADALLRSSPEIEEAHEITVLTVDVAKDLCGRFEFEDHRL